jgi:nucleoside-diphosphate-sugar epimerase
MSTTVDATRDPLVAADSVRRWLDTIPRPVAVTGGTGFIGSHLVDTLCAAGVEPRVLVRDPEAPRWIGDRPARRVPGSLDDDNALRALVEGAGTVFHMAGVTNAVRAADFDYGNRAGTARLVAAVLDGAPETRMIHVSSLAAVGPSPDPAGVGPAAEPRPVSDYGRSKLAAEHEARRAAWWVIVRPPAVYGPRDTDVLEFFRMARAGVAAVPAGERWLTIVHVTDVVRGLLAAAAGEAGRTYHLGNPAPHRIDDLLRLVAEAGGRRVRIVRVPPAMVRVLAAATVGLRRLGMRRMALTPDKARELVARHWTARTRESLALLGIEDWTRFADGARETWAWYRSQGWLG